LEAVDVPQLVWDSRLIKLVWWNKNIETW